jgi:hypothetical protein
MTPHLLSFTFLSLQHECYEAFDGSHNFFSSMHVSLFCYVYMSRPHYFHLSNLPTNYFLLVWFQLTHPTASPLLNASSGCDLSPDGVAGNIHDGL